MNVICITGNLTRDVELRYTSNGKAVATFCVAVKRPRTSERTDFIDCVAWEKTAEFVSKHFSKGSGIAVSGCISTRTWETDEGKKRKAVEVICNDIGFMGRKKSDDGNEYKGYSVNPYEEYTMIEEDDSDLPF